MQFLRDAPQTFAGIPVLHHRLTGDGLDLPNIGDSSQ